MVPSAGVVTSLSYNANEQIGQIRAAFFLPVQNNNFTLVGKSDLLTVTPNKLNTYPTRFPVQQGWRMGLYVSLAGMNCNGPTALPGDTQRFNIFDPGTQTNFGPGPTDSGLRVNLAAVVESDADGDGFGDVSQDQCAESAATQQACPAPDTTVTKKPKNSSKRKAKIKFSSVPGATFTCAVDGKPAKPCTSPFKKRYGYGKHKVLITATSPFGIVDPTPAKVRFKVVRPD